MPIETLTATGTAQPLVAQSDWYVAGCPRPTQRYCRALTFRLLTSGTVAYVGLQRPLGVGPAATSAAYDVLLSDETPTFRLGGSTDKNDIDMGDIYWDGSATDMQIDIAPETA